jgi:hypothetical protein
MISLGVKYGAGVELTEDEGDDNGLDILSTGLVGISREIGNVKAQGGIVSKNAVEVWKGTFISRCK